MMSWKVCDTGVDRAADIMAFDAELLEKASELKGPCIHFYDWQLPSITYGYFIEPSQLLNLKAVEEWGIDLARRPTGGGIVFHMFDMAFSVVVPASSPWYSLNTLDNYALINGAVLRAVELFLQEHPRLELTAVDGVLKEKECSHFCMARPTKYDVMQEGRKIAGAAQRKTRAGFLHQGMISLVAPDEALLKSVLLHYKDVMIAMREYTLPLIKAGDSTQDAKRKLKELLVVQLTTLPVY